ASTGSPEEVARACSREASLVAVERALWLVVAGLLALGGLWQLGVILYPRGQWIEPPHILYGPHHVGLIAWAATSVAGAVAVLALRVWRLSARHAALARTIAQLLVGALAVHVVAGNLYVWLRNDIVAGSPSNGVQAALSAIHVMVAALAVAPLAIAARRLRRLTVGAGPPAPAAEAGSQWSVRGGRRRGLGGGRRRFCRRRGRRRGGLVVVLGGLIGLRGRGALRTRRDADGDARRLGGRHAALAVLDDPQRPDRDQRLRVEVALARAVRRFHRHREVQVRPGV